MSVVAPLPPAADWWIGAVLGVVVLAVYIATLCPTVPGGDSAELISVAYTLGVAHPPGYPLWTLIGKLFTFIPYGSIAWRVNLFSAVCDTLAAVLLFGTVRRWSGNAWAGVAAAALFAFSPLVWAYATVAEVFPLNNLFVAAALYLSHRYATDRDERVALLGAFVAGLGLSNHHTFLFVAFPFAMWILWVGRDTLFTPRRFLSMVACFAVGFLPYGYLPWAASHYPEISWGHTQSWDGFLTHFLRSEYGTFQLASDQIGAKNQLTTGLLVYAQDVLRQAMYVGVPLGIVGVHTQWKRQRWAGMLPIALLAFVTYVIVFHKLSNLELNNLFNREVTARFWQQANIFVYLFAGLGIATLFEWVGARLPERLALVSTILSAATAVGIAGAQGVLHFRESDQSKNRIFEQFAHAILDGLPPHAILLSSGDVYSNTVRYLQVGEHLRPDVRVMDRAMLSYDWNKALVAHTHPEIVLPGFAYRYNDPAGFNLEKFIRANAGLGEIFLANLQKSEDRGWESHFTSWPWGVINLVTPKEMAMDIPLYIQRTDTLLSPLRDVAFRKYKVGSWEHYVWREYWEADHRRARRILLQTTQGPEDPVAVRTAIHLMEDLLKRDPQPTGEMYRNLGIMYSRLLNKDVNAEEEMVRAWRVYLAVYRETNSLGDRDLREIRSAVERYEAKQKGQKRLTSPPK